ncbi:MAG: PhoH family protein [Bacteroidetes bacterium]|jgi:phosphate starvation-inducible PhoH-like protein|nr:PhoH family protein [Bacteroidota bacterium]MBT6684715.1 PhoH family protein [Bacteroidota bacterium]MBT7143159.1 PhoH family protein [Bacteroidota bacterium]MBT7492602.1 PhoH family protein [Bacteroidota bacterium]
MIEKIIYLKEVDPLLLLGVNNSRLERMKIFFPKLKIIARGEELKLFGDENEINNFEKKIKIIINHYCNNSNLTNSEFERILTENIDEIEVRQNSDNEVLLFGNNGKLIRAATKNQKLLVEQEQKNDMIFAIGPAGTGKTYTSIALAVRALRSRWVKRIILSRPAVEAGENLGFLPGDMKEKIDPYLQPLYDALRDMIPSRKLRDMIEDEVIQIAPLAYMRGRTLNNAFVILDEAQNTTENQIKMFLTRMGSNSKFVINGDITQIDLPKKQQSGLIKALKILKAIKGISIIHFNEKDNMRHPLVKDIVEAYHKDN